MKFSLAYLWVGGYHIAPAKQLSLVGSPIMTATRTFNQSIALQFRVVHDAVGLLRSGTMDARLTDDGLELGNSATGAAVLIPYETEVRHDGGPFLLIPLESGDLRLALTTPGVDQVRMARDLAKFIQGKRTTFDTLAYRLPKSLLALAFLPLTVPLVMFAVYIQSTMPSDDVGYLIFCAVPSVLLAALFFRLARAGTPSVCARVVLGLALTFVVSAAQGAYFTYQTWNYIDYYAWLPGRGTLAESQWVEFVPDDRRFRIDFPGEPMRREERVANTDKVTIAHGVDLKHSAYLVFVVELSSDELGQATPGARFNAARDNYLKKNPNAKLVSEQNQEIDGYPGREFAFSNPEMKNFVTRVYLVGRRFYTLVAGGRLYTSETPNVKRFFQSFELLPPTAASPKTIKGLVSAWSFDEQEGKLAMDASGAGLHAEIHGATRVSGIRGNALQFDGKSYLLLPDDKNFHLSEGWPYSITGWFKTTKASCAPFLSIQDKGDVPRKAEVFLLDGRFKLTATSPFSVDTLKHVNPGALQGDFLKHVIPPRVSDDRWHHFGIVVGQDRWARVLIDSVPTNHLPTSVKNASIDRKVGIGFEGSLDEIAIFKRNLKDDEIKVLAGQ